MAEWQIEPLADHERGEFSCGKAPLDVFLHTQASQYEKRGVGRTCVAVRPDSKRVIGYYTLAASSVEFVNFPETVRKKLPRHPVPTILLGRLAVDVSARGEGLGSGLLTDALERVLGVADVIGVFAVNVHALDDEARGFYAKHGFAALVDQERHLFMTVATILTSFE
jgi:predicted GNAT family N-acyltransferase